MQRTLLWMIGIAAFTLSGTASCRPAASGQGVTSDKWQTYVNPRYRYRICYPPGLLRPLAEADNGDGRSFVGTDHSRLSVFGRNNIDRSTLAGTADGNAADLAGPRGKLTYRAVRPGWAAYSGDDGGSMLFYGKAIQRGDQFVIFEISYPKVAAARYKPVVERLSRCFATTG